jgi:hypothetical protein
MTPHDKAIEAIAKAKHAVAYANSQWLPRWDDLTAKERAHHCKLLEYDIAAYLAALEAEGGAWRGYGGVPSEGGDWLNVATDKHIPIEGVFSVLIIKDCRLLTPAMEGSEK